MKQETTLPSHDGQHQLYVVTWTPTSKPHCIVQLVHGMREHMGKYDHFATWLAQQGIAVIGHDHLGHGRTVNAPEELGYFHPQPAEQLLVADVYRVTQYAKAQFPDLPLIIWGHSMGSIILRSYLLRHSHDVDGAFVMGTRARRRIITHRLSEWLLALLQVFHGERGKSNMISNMSDKTLNAEFSADGVPNSWITRDLDIVRQCNADPLCNYQFTINGYRTIVRLLKEIDDAKNWKMMRQDLPLRLYAGLKDPLTNYGEGVAEIAKTLEVMGFVDVQCHLYPDCRHELINELNRLDIYQDIYHNIQEIVQQTRRTT